MSMKNIITKFYYDFTGGVNANADLGFTPALLADNQLIACKNTYWLGGLKMRSGSIKYDAAVLAVSSPVRGLHKFYRRSAASQLLAACSGGIYEHVPGGGWSKKNTSRNLTGSKKVFFTTYGPTQKVFIATDTDAPFIWDGTNISNYTAAPQSSKNFLVHKERIFTYYDLNISYSDNLNPDVWSSAALTLASQDPEITAMTEHSQAVADESVISELLFFTANNIWVLTGNDFIYLNDVFLQQLSSNIGTSTPATVVQTPVGTIFFGRQQGRNNVFMVSGQGLNASVIPIGDNIRQVLQSIQSNDFQAMSAVYADGFYRIWFRGSEDTNNKQEWWLSMDSLIQNKPAWYGPMNRGIGISSQVVLSGGNDNNDLLAGGDDGFVYKLNTGTSDEGGVIACQVQTRYDNFSAANRRKKVVKLYLKQQATGGVINMSALADYGEKSGGKSITLVDSTNIFPYTFPVTFPAPSSGVKAMGIISKDVKGTEISVKVDFSSKDFQLLINSIGLDVQLDNDSIKENI